jgi:putative ATPase
MQDGPEGKTLPVPLHLRIKFRKELATESGADTAAMQYLYSHDYDGHFTPQAYLPEGRTYYKSSENGMEKRIAERLLHWRNQLEQNRD